MGRRLLDTDLMSDRRGHVDNVRELRPPPVIDNPGHPCLQPLYDHTAEPVERFVVLPATVGRRIATMLLHPTASNDQVRDEAVRLLRGAR